MDADAFEMSGNCGVGVVNREEYDDGEIVRAVLDEADGSRANGKLAARGDVQGPVPFSIGGQVETDRRFIS